MPKQHGIGLTLHVPTSPPVPDDATWYAGYVWNEDEEEWDYVVGAPFTPYPGWPAARVRPTQEGRPHA